MRTLLGSAQFLDGKSATVRADTGESRIEAEHLIIATGSEPVELPALPFGGDVMSSTESLALTEVPATLAVVGAGYIGLELGTAFAKMGARVTIVEALAKILPLYDFELTLPVAQRLDELGVETLIGAGRYRFADGALGRRGGRRRSGRSPPTRSWSPSAGGRAPAGSDSKSSI